VAVAPAAHSRPANGKPQAESAGSAKTDLWITLGIIGLILGGMLLGAAITKLWIYHFAPSPGGGLF
jgi:hypothetical protein